MLDKNKLARWLNELLGDELISANQYYIAYNACVGDNQGYLRSQFEEHYKEEMDHFSILIEAMMQRRLDVDYDLLKLINQAKSGYTALDSNGSTYLTKFFSQREKEAINSYTSFHKFIKNDDPTLDDLIINIINQESDHKLDMDRLMETTGMLQQKESPVELSTVRIFADSGKETKRQVVRGANKNPSSVLKTLFSQYKDADREQCTFAFLVNFNDDWSSDVETSWVPPEGLFTRSADEIADELKKASKDKKQAIARLTFYINRAGSNLSQERLTELNKAKTILMDTNFSTSLYDELFR